MPEHGSFHPRRVHPKPREKGAAHSAVHSHRRHKSMEGKYGVVGDGATITGATVDTSGTYPGITLDDQGLHAYNSGGTQTFLLSAADGSLTVLGGGTITGGTIRTSSTFPYVIFDSAGVRAYNTGGVLTFNLNSSDGSLTVTGASTITGGTIQSSSSNPRTVMDASGFRAYNLSGINTITVSASDGSVTVTGGTITGAIIQTAGVSPRVVLDTAGIRAYSVTLGQTVNIGSDGTFWFNTSGASLLVSSTGINFNSQPQSASGARVMIDSTGIKGYNASNQQEFLLDAASGLITATGIITANPGSTVPWQTTGFFIGGGNQLSNGSAEDPTSTTQLLYSSTGAITAGTFTLKYGSNPASVSLPYNATAVQIQSALNAGGVLPASVIATCSGGPLPQLPITISLAGFTTVAPSVLTVTNSSMVGGSMVTGQSVTGWTVSGGILDTIPYSQAFHGGQVFRLTNSHTFTSFPSTTSYPSSTSYPGATAASTPVIGQIIGPYGLVPGTAYTLSGYFSAPLAGRSPRLTIAYLDIQSNVVATISSTALWTTTTNWQRFVLTETVPPAYTRQGISTSGTVTGGSFTVTYNGQTTGAIVYNATAAQVLSALQALSNVGPSGVAFATGGPLPNNPVYVSFVSPPALTPSALTATSSLTGTTPGIVISNMQPVYIQAQVSVPSLANGEILYADAVQLEVGDAPTAFAPRGDEILANTIQANMINVGQLSAISANLGTITAGTVTGATIQTATTGSRVVMNSTGLFGYDSLNNTTFQLTGAVLNMNSGSINAGVSVSLQAYEGSTFGFNPQNRIDFVRTSTGGVIGDLVGAAWANSPVISQVQVDAYAVSGSDRSVASLQALDDAGNAYAWITCMQTGQGNQDSRVRAGSAASTLGSGICTVIDYSGEGIWGGPLYATAFNVSSSEALKSDPVAPDKDLILSKIESLRVTEHSHKLRPGIRSIGPFAEDFYRQFGFGNYLRPQVEDVLEVEKHPFLSLGDLAGINLVGVQALAQKVRSLESLLSRICSVLERADSVEEIKSRIPLATLAELEEQHFLETINPQSEVRRLELERRITQHKEAVP